MWYCIPKDNRLPRRLLKARVDEEDFQILIFLELFQISLDQIYLMIFLKVLVELEEKDEEDRLISEAQI